jgi:hypothetical protein
VNLFTGVDDRGASKSPGLLKNCDGLNGSCFIGEFPLLTGCFPTPSMAAKSSIFYEKNHPRTQPIFSPRATLTLMSSLQSGNRQESCPSLSFLLLDLAPRLRIGGVEALVMLMVFVTGTKEFWLRFDGTSPTSEFELTFVLFDGRLTYAS